MWTKKQRRNAWVILVTILMVTAALLIKNDYMDDSHEYSDTELVGTACTHPGCNCQQYYGHYNKKGELYGECMQCRHSYQEHGLDNSQQRFASGETSVEDLDVFELRDDSDE